MKINAWKQRLIVAVLCICVLAYTLYHVGSLFGEEISTFAAGVITETDSVSGSGYVFRDETVLYSDLGGVVNYLCDDGTKVTTGQALAEIHENGTAADRRRMALIDNQISVLERSTEGTVGATDIATLRGSIDDQYYMLSRALASGETGELSLQIENMLVDLNRMSVVTEDSSAVTTTLQSLRDQKSKMLTNGGNAVTAGAPEGGYFYTDADGYETLFTMDALSVLTPRGFYELLSSPAEKTKNANGTAYGKLAKDSTWGFALEIPFRSADFFEVDGVYSVQFTENNGISLPMTLQKMLGSAEQSTVILIFSCDRLPENFAFHRCQSVRVETQSVSGIYIPQKAVVERGDFQGVYILRGSVVRFRYIDIVYEGSDYYLVAPDGGGDEGVVYLAENDLVIVGGTKLFDGRILE